MASDSGLLVARDDELQAAQVEVSVVTVDERGLDELLSSGSVELAGRQVLGRRAALDHAAGPSRSWLELRCATKQQDALDLLRQLLGKRLTAWLSALAAQPTSPTPGRAAAERR